MTVEHAQFKKANTAVHLPFFTPHFNHLDLLAAEGLEAMLLTQAHHWFQWLIREVGQISQKRGQLCFVVLKNHTPKNAILPKHETWKSQILVCYIISAITPKFLVTSQPEN